MSDTEIRKRLGAGELLFREGDPADCAYVLESGRLGVTVERDGGPHLLAEMSPGSLVGEMALLDHGTRTATVTALEPSSLQRLERDRIKDRVDAADPVLQHMLKVLISRYRDVVRRLNGGADAGPLSSTPAPPETNNHSRRAAVRDLTDDQELHDALRRKQFVLHYQPIVHMADHSVAGFEALIRWAHPDRGLVMPAEFISNAEETGLIVEMGHWIIRTAAEALARIEEANPQRDRMRAPLFMTINLSGHQFSDPRLVTELRDAMSRSRLEPGRLRVEITESALVDKIPEAAALMARCSDLGVKLAVDDFGTGYSALSYLYRLPVSIVKFAHGFITDLERFPESEKVVGAVSRLAHELEMDTIAEGIESADQASILRSMGIRYGQGFHYSAALPLTDASAYLRRAPAPFLIRPARTA